MLLQGLYKKMFLLAVIKLHCVFMAAVDQCGAMLVLDMCTHLTLSCTVPMIYIKMLKCGNISIYIMWSKTFFDVVVKSSRF